MYYWRGNAIYGKGGRGLLLKAYRIGVDIVEVA
jgi:hypothetical protein